jgi:hypothetical protein
MATLKPLRFIEEPIDVQYDIPPIMEKRPGCPDEFSWRGSTYRIVDLLSEWHDYQRRGRMARNMRTEHAATARKRGSWGVGKDYYCVLTDSEQIFEIYYDRAPKDVDNRKGAWFLFQELSCPF